MLPDLLSDRLVSWEWASLTDEEIPTPANAIRGADIFIGILNNTRSDYRVLHETGIAAGLEKPILLITKPSSKIPIDLSHVVIAKVSLHDRRALGLHLDAFLSAPSRSIFDRASLATSQAPEPPAVRSTDVRSNTPERELERRLFELIEQCGGSAISHPATDIGEHYRPDLLVWLGSLDAELLDPAVIEVKTRVERSRVRDVEEQLLSFMSATGVRTGIVVTHDPVPERNLSNWPNVFWLQIDALAHLLQSGNLGSYLREARNRAAHGSR